MIQIKRLLQSSQEFVPITLAEAVVVNANNIPGLSSLKITTLDKVLKTILGIIGTNSVDIDNLEKLVEAINAELENKQDKLTAGTGITISPEGVISATNSVELYKIVLSLPYPAGEEYLNKIYLVPNQEGTSGNIFKEYICYYSESLKAYYWEQIGEIQTDVDLSGYVTKQEFNQLQTKVTQIENTMLSMITAINVTTSGGSNVTVDYDIPNDLYE